MSRNKCPECNHVNFPYDTVCQGCGKTLKYTAESPPPTADFLSSVRPPTLLALPGRNELSGADILHIAVWSIAALLIGLRLFSLENGMENATGAPQQAVAAAYNACMVVIYYCLARAASFIIRTCQGK